MKRIVAIGGGETGRPETSYETYEIDKEIVSLSGKENPNVLFIGTASSDDDSYFEIISKVFSRLNCNVSNLALTKKTYTIETIDIKDYNKTDEEIIYMGWIRAGILNGYNKMKNSNIKCAIGVGMAPNREDVVNKLINQNNISHKFFYLQGGMDVSRLEGFNKFLFNMVKSVVNKSKKIEDQEMKEILNSEGKFIKKENLKEILEYLK